VPEGGGRKEGREEVSAISIRTLEGGGDAALFFWRGLDSRRRCWYNGRLSGFVPAGTARTGNAGVPRPRGGGGMVRRYELAGGKIVESQNEQSPILVYINPSDAEKKYLTEDLKLDEHTLTSSLDPDELSRLEFEPEHVALIFKRPKNYAACDNFLFRVSSLGLFLFKDKLVVLLAEDIPLFEGKPYVRGLSLPKVMLSLLYRSIFHFIEHLKIINMLSDSLEQKINASMENKYLLNLFILEKSLVYYLNAINSNTMVIEKIKNNIAKIGIDGDTQEFLDDIFIENNQCYKQAEIYSNILSGLMDARAGIVGNNLNVLMKTLNIITICIMMPTLVVSIFSMNIDFPLQHHPLAFLFVLSLAVISGIGFLFFWKRKKW
jgi:magnesium transporter